MANPFVHVELSTTDLGQAKTFYGKLFDWKMQDIPMPQGSYTMIDVGEVRLTSFPFFPFYGRKNFNSSGGNVPMQMK